MASVESSPDINEFSNPGGSGTNECMDGRADGRAEGEMSPKISWADEEHVDESSMPDTLKHLIKKIYIYNKINQRLPEQLMDE